MIRCKLPELLGRRRMKIKELSIKTGISYRSLLRMYNEEKVEINIDHIAKICEALECGISDLYEYEKRGD